MTTLFISDLHLNAQEPETVAAFLSFLNTKAHEAEALYILGDLFNAWVGDDATDATEKSVIQALKEISQQVPIYVMHGNRDFLLGKRFFKESGCQFLADPTVISLYGKKILLMHGDTLCTLDTGYQKLRHWVRKTWLQKIFLALPTTWRQMIAKKLRKASQHYDARSDEARMNVTECAVQEALQRHQADVLIHGHTHRPSIQSKHIVLSDWHATDNHVLCAETTGELRDEKL